MRLGKGQQLVRTPRTSYPIKEPPKPLPPEVRIVGQDGRPTPDFHRYLNALWEWQKQFPGDITGP